MSIYFSPFVVATMADLVGKAVAGIPDTHDEKGDIFAYVGDDKKVVYAKRVYCPISKEYWTIADLYIDY